MLPPSSDIARLLSSRNFAEALTTTLTNPVRSFYQLRLGDICNIDLISTKSTTCCFSNKTWSTFYISTPQLKRYLESYLTEGNDPLILNSQYCDCRSPGDAGSHKVNLGSSICTGSAHLCDICQQQSKQLYCVQVTSFIRNNVRIAKPRYKTSGLDIVQCDKDRSRN